MASISAAELQRQHLQSSGAATAASSAAPVKAPMADPFPSLGGDEDPFSNGPSARSNVTTAAEWGPLASESAASKTNGKSAPAGPAPQKQQAQPDFSSESAFPTLGSAAGKPSASSAWSKKLASSSNGKSAPPVQQGWTSSAPVIQRNVLNETFSLPTSSDMIAKLPAVLARVRAKFGGSGSAANSGVGAHAGAVTIEASTTRKTSTTTFILKGENEKMIKAARKELTVALAKSVTLPFTMPASLRAFVIGAKGKNLKAITEQTGVRINIPKAEDTPADGIATPGPASGNAADDYDLGEQITVTIEGDEINAKHAQRLLQAIVAERTSKITQRLTNIDHVFYPFIAGPKNANVARLEKEEELGAGEVSVRVPPRAAFLPPREGAEDGGAANGNAGFAGNERERDLSIIVSGEREAVARVIAAIEAQVDDMRRNFRTLAIQIPKRQHRFLVGESAQEVLASTGCSIELAPIDDPSDSVTIRGPSANLANALTEAMAKANAVNVQIVDLVAAHRSIDHAKDLIRWLNLGRLPRVAGVQVFTPRLALLESSGQAQIEIVGKEAEEVEKVRAKVDALVKRTTPAFVQKVEIDPLLWGYVIGKKGANTKQYEVKGVDIVFPHNAEAAAAGEGSSQVLLVLGSPAPQAASMLENLPAEKKAREAKAAEVLNEVKAEVMKASEQAADMQTETLQIPSKLHRYILGQNGTTLNALIGEDRLVAVKVGAGRTAATPGKKEDEDAVVVRGPSAEVQRVVKEINRIAEEAEQDSIVNGHVGEIVFDAAHIPHLVGKGGAAITKLREELGIRVDISDPVGEGKKRKAKATLTGRKENVEEARKRLQMQVERLDDETQLVVKIPAALHGQIIGQGGKYVTRLQDTYGVRIQFPSADASANGESKQKPDEVVIRGGKKGVEQAKSELVELVAYEQEHNNVANLSVTSKSVARIMGKGGSSINQIRDESGAQIDVEKEDESSGNGTVNITIKGTTKAIDAAKKAITSIAREVDAEQVYTLNIPAHIHGQLIGAGGQAIRDLVVRAGGPEDSKSVAQLVSFPRRDDKDKDTVVVRGPEPLASKIKAELEAVAQEAASRVVLGVSIPVATHRQLIGRAGARQKELEAKHNIRVIFPGSRIYASTPEPNNKADLASAAAETIVKVQGVEDACKAAMAEMTESLASASRTVQVPRAVHTKLATPMFFRQMRSDFGVSVDVPRNLPRTDSGAKPSSSARIDADDTEADGLAFELEELNLDGIPPVDWTLSGKDEASLDKAEKKIKAAVEKAGDVSHEGKLWVPQSAVPRIIGKQGSGLQALQTETSTNIEIPREGGGLCIIRGSKDAILAAKDRLEEIVERRRDRD